MQMGRKVNEIHRIVNTYQRPVCLIEPLISEHFYYACTCTGFMLVETNARFLFVC